MIAQYIKTLLETHDQVILAEIGSFSVQHISAEVHLVSHQFSPPSESIILDTRIKGSNGLLENYIAQQENITYEEAQAKVKQYGNKLRIELNLHKNVEIDELGSINLDKDGNWNFRALEEEGFSLPELVSKPIDRKEIPVTQQAISKDKTPKATTEKIAKKSFSNNNGLAIAAIFLLIATSAFLIYMLVFDNKKPTVAQKTVIKDTTTIATTPIPVVDSVNPNDANIDTTQWTANNTIEPPIETNNTPTTTEPVVNTPVTPTPKEKEPITPPINTNPPTNNVPDANEVGFLVPSKVGRYFIVVGSFDTKARAMTGRNKVLTKENANPKIILPNPASNRHRVSYNDYEDEIEAKVKTQQIKNEFPDAWILKY